MNDIEVLREGLTGEDLVLFKPDWLAHDFAQAEAVFIRARERHVALIDDIVGDARGQLAFDRLMFSVSGCKAERAFKKMGRIQHTAAQLCGIELVETDGDLGWLPAEYCEELGYTPLTTDVWLPQDYCG